MSATIRSSSHFLAPVTYHTMYFDVIIIGAGPAGLSCAIKLSKSNLKVLVLEQKRIIGPKVCAGGITWSGLLRVVPEDLIERSFYEQKIFSRFQKFTIVEDNPIIATISRKNLGQYMAREASNKGVTIKSGSTLRNINLDSIEVFDREEGTTASYRYSYLVGADGSSSPVRRYLNLPATHRGVGINYQIEADHLDMEWHLRHKFFNSGYGWIFPHKKTLSIGAYIAKKSFSAHSLNVGLCNWAQKMGFNLHNHKCRSGFINYDYRGWCFNNIFLAGDAAGLASALTGEGIYPAILSGEAVAEKILNPGKQLPFLDRLIRTHRQHARVVERISKNAFSSTLMAELGVFSLRTGLVNFTKLEMGHQ